MEENQIIDKNKQLEKDLKYIKGDILAFQNNGLICKICKPLNCITVTNMTEDRYIRYWQSNYKSKQDYETGRFDKITKACKDKLLNGMHSLDEVIEIELNSKDTQEEKEKLIEEITKKEYNNVGGDEEGGEE